MPKSTLLLIIGGIIKTYEYRMIPYILSENPDISRTRAFEISKQMMKGNKWDTLFQRCCMLPRCRKARSA